MRLGDSAYELLAGKVLAGKVSARIDTTPGMGCGACMQLCVCFMRSNLSQQLDRMGIWVTVHP